MATTTLFYVQVNATGGSRVKPITPASIEGLLKKPTLSDSKQKKAGEVIALLTAPAPKEELKPTAYPLSELVTGYDEFIDRTEAILQYLTKNSKNLIYEFDPAENFELSTVVASLFKGEYKRITYDMYLAALRLDKDLARKIGEETSGHTKYRSASNP
jgi:hypothetical protein